MNSNDINQLILNLGDPINLLIGLTGLIAILTAWSVNKALKSMKAKLGIKPKKSKRWSFKSFNKSMWDDVPVEKEHDILLDHDYDGIQELDNNLPPWWIWGFYLSIVWSVVYLGYYHFTEDAQLQDAQFNTEMAAREATRVEYLANAGQQVDETSAVQLFDEESLASGKAIYDVNCMACHAADGGGSVGPNFTDAYWIHGGSIADIFSVIKYGVIEKGMIPWADQLNPQEIHEVSSYIMSLVGTTAADPKEAQGKLHVAQVTDIPAESTTLEE